MSGAAGWPPRAAAPECRMQDKATRNNGPAEVFRPQPRYRQDDGYEVQCPPCDLNVMSSSSVPRCLHCTLKWSTRARTLAANVGTLTVRTGLQSLLHTVVHVIHKAPPRSHCTAKPEVRADGYAISTGGRAVVQSVPHYSHRPRPTVYRLCAELFIRHVLRNSQQTSYAVSLALGFRPFRACTSVRQL